MIILKKTIDCPGGMVFMMRGVINEEKWPVTHCKSRLFRIPNQQPMRLIMTKTKNHFHKNQRGMLHIRPKIQNLFKNFKLLHRYFKVFDIISLDIFF